MENRETRTRMSKEDRREQIIESAMKVFIDKGYNGTTTAEVAKVANISEVTLFRYFDSKRELFLAVIEPILMDTLKESIIATRDLEPVERLRFILTERINLISKNHMVVRLILMESQVNPELGDLNYIEKISKLLKDSINQMGFTIKNEDITFRLLMGSILSYLYFPEINSENINLFVDSILKYIIDNKN